MEVKCRDNKTAVLTLWGTPIDKMINYNLTINKIYKLVDTCIIHPRHYTIIDDTGKETVIPKHLFNEIGGNT